MRRGGGIELPDPLGAAGVNVAPGSMGNDAPAVHLLVLADLARLNAGGLGRFEDRLRERVVGVLFAVRCRLQKRGTFDAFGRSQARNRGSRARRPSPAWSSTAGRRAWASASRR